MNSETMDTTNSTTTGLNGVGAQAKVQRVADKAHEAVDTVAQSLNTGAERVIGWHDEYGEMAREQIRANPLAVVFGAFAIGYVFAKLTK
ncbi:hypothetical protein [Ramlibacter sp. PS4R-6]|uniref:hypothetical protein n=1 Tax=Ramlibacter sp. PS4R-6 TaxID=3133438 RepID=UPI0030A06136